MFQDMELSSSKELKKKHSQNVSYISGDGKSLLFKSFFKKIIHSSSHSSSELLQ